MPSQWDDRADKDLLLSIIDEGALKSVLWPKIADNMKAKGYTFSAEACRQHYQKLRKDSNKSKDPSRPASTTSTPRKRSAAKPKPKSTSFNTSTSNTSFSDDDEEINGSPTPVSKKRKAETKVELSDIPAYRFKAEAAGDEEEDGVIDLERDE